MALFMESLQASYASRFSLAAASAAWRAASAAATTGSVEDVLTLLLLLVLEAFSTPLAGSTCCIAARLRLRPAFMLSSTLLLDDEPKPLLSAAVPFLALARSRAWALLRSCSAV